MQGDKKLRHAPECLRWALEFFFCNISNTSDINFPDTNQRGCMSMDTRADETDVDPIFLDKDVEIR